ncbi:YhcH/YjgK/YiaL family protein [Paenibacillus sp. LHD-117]|uniref:YhcH/YjgK/YiaL family protein n=1 Tax=Paenibacillus sp. LHD-117 TaxID=3071412 RepID=UPI0027DFA106|nr:YhcH/YjgK/YiaL family protein [Paenibacillus sp. LHD-117]MDQ6422973.1 YhcH/YjgK/YiaL family protein [Paenibacillus sp. LHD-117]
MIYDKIENAGLYIFQHAGLARALEDLRFNLIGQSDSNAFSKNIAQFVTSPKEQKQYEAHKKYIDIHVVLEGKEYIEVSHIDSLTNVTAYDETRDIWFGDVQTASKLKGMLEPGYFLVCFPEDAHLVGAHEQHAEDVKKIIYKIAV